MTGRSGRSPAVLNRCLVLLHRYSVDITGIAAATLAPSAGNREIQVLTALSHGALGIGDISRILTLQASTTTRILHRLELGGLVQRSSHAADLRRTEVRLTAVGRRRLRTFARRLGDYFDAGAPVVKEVLHLLELDAAPTAHLSRDPVTVAEGMAAAGAAFTEDAAARLASYGRLCSSDRFALMLLRERGSVTPTILADELGLATPSVTAVLDRMEDQRLLLRRRRSRPGDRRGTTVTLTARGTRAADTVLAVFDRHADAVGRALAATLPR